MKELWSYMAVSFTNYEKYAKKIKKSQHLSDIPGCRIQFVCRAGAG